MRPVAPLVLIAAVLVGCSDGADETAPSPAPTVTTASPTPEPEPIDPLSPKPAVESPAPVGQPTCRVADLTVTDADQYDADEGIVHEVYVLRTKGKPCQLEGYPRVTFLDAAGRRLPLTARQSGFALPEEEAAPVTLTTGTSLSFLVGARTTGTCRQAATVVVTLPGTNRPLSAATPLELCGPDFGVSPIRRLTDDE